MTKSKKRIKKNLSKKSSKKSQTKKVKSIKSSNKITISIDWSTKDKGFSVLKSKRVMKFLLENIKNGNNLIQTQHMKPFKAKGKTKMYLQAIKFNSFTIDNKWKDLECKKHADWIKSSPCVFKGNGNKKVFIKYKSNENIAGFAVYLIRLFTGEIDLEKHKQFVKAMQKTMKDRSVFIDCMNVTWFHIISSQKIH